MMSVGGNDNDNRHYLRAFIQTYRDLPVLWDTSLREYSNREKRAEAYENLVPIYRYLKRDASVEDVKKKINTLRTNYRKELKVVESARRAGTVHHPRCWTFHELNFLRNAEKFLSVTPVRSDASLAFNESSQKMPNAAGFMDTNYSFRSIMGNSPAQSPPNVSEMFQKSFGHQPQKLEPQQTPPPSGVQSEFSTHISHNHSHHQHDDSKRQRLSSLGSIVGATGIKMQNAEELIGIACDYLSTTFPEEESIVRTWTHKLKRMSRDQRLLAEKFINDILFEGESGNLNRGSVQINAFEPFVRFEEQPHTAGSSSDELVKSQSPSVHTSTLQDAEPKSLNISTTEGATAATNANAASAPDSFANFN